MSLKRNILANYVSQIYVTLIGIVMVPMYIRYMGAEAYGLVAIFATLQALFNLLDIGIAPTVSRETARFHGGATTVLQYRRLLRALQIIFVCTALTGSAVVYFMATPIATRWLNLQTLAINDVAQAIQLMSFSIGMRWMAGLYRGVIFGTEKMEWLGGANVIIATLRFGLVMPVLLYIGTSPKVFFTYQLLIAMTELLLLASKAHALLPKIPSHQFIGWNRKVVFSTIKSIWRFSLSIAFTSSAWIIVTQTDKVALSKMLSLSEYGYFTVAVLAASAVMTASTPIASAIIPRMNRLYAAGNQSDAIALYRKATRLVGTISFSLAFVLVFFSEEILLLWTKNAALATNTKSVLAFYALGYAILSVTALTAHLQAAKGQMRLHVIGTALFIVFYVPILIISVKLFNVNGAGFAWLLVNSMYILLWIPLIHTKFENILHRLWLWKDLGVPFMAALSSVYIADKLVNIDPNSYYSIIALTAITAVAIIFSLSLTNEFRIFAKKIIRNWNIQ